MILLLIECLNHLGIKIDTDLIFEAYSEIVGSSEGSSILKVDLDKVWKDLGEDENYVTVFKEDLKKNYFEIRNELANTTIDTLLGIIWKQIGFGFKAEDLYPFRSAIMNGFVKEQTVIYEEVIDQFCEHLMNMAQREGSANVDKKYVEGDLWPGLIFRNLH